MPRQSRGPSSQPRRPSVPPTRASAPMPQQPAQTRQASTVAHPPAGAAGNQAGAPAKQSAGPGLFGTMASTAAGAVVGTSIGHALGGFFGGSGSQEAAPAADPNQPLAQSNDGSYAVNSAYAPPQGCADDVKNFRGCMDENRGDLTICGWYLDQLKACQGAAARY